jgi:hypothetical protein
MFLIILNKNVCNVKQLCLIKNKLHKQAVETVVDKEHVNAYCVFKVRVV